MPDAAIIRAATSAPVMPDEAGTSLYFAYAAFTLQVAQSERASVPRNRKMLNAVILLEDTTLFCDSKAIPTLRFFLLFDLGTGGYFNGLWGTSFRDTYRKLSTTRCSNPTATSEGTTNGSWLATPECRAKNSKKNVIWPTTPFSRRGSLLPSITIRKGPNGFFPST